MKECYYDLLQKCQDLEMERRKAAVSFWEAHNKITHIRESFRPFDSFDIVMQKAKLKANDKVEKWINENREIVHFDMIRK